MTLIDDIYKSPIPGYKLSGYSILGETPRNTEIAVSVIIIEQKCVGRKYKINKILIFQQGNISGDKRPIYFIFPGMGSQSLDLVKDLMKLDIFKAVVDKAHAVLVPHGYSVYDLFYKPNENTFNSIVNVTITIIIVQVLCRTNITKTKLLFLH